MTRNWDNLKKLKKVRPKQRLEDLESLQTKHLRKYQNDFKRCTNRKDAKIPEEHTEKHKILALAELLEYKKKRDLNNY